MLEPPLGGNYRNVNTSHIPPAPSRGPAFLFILHGHLHLDLLVGRVADDLEVLEGDSVNVLLVRVDLKHREGAGGFLQLLPQRLHVVRVHVRVPQRVDEVAGPETCGEGEFAVCVDEVAGPETCGGNS
eukprot:1190768-Prorocentrum_minimum.AAC.2